MSDDDTQPADMDEVLRLVTALAEQILKFEIAAPSIDPARLMALMGAAQLLTDNDVPLPAPVHEALGQIRERMRTP